MRVVVKVVKLVSLLFSVLKGRVHVYIETKGRFTTFTRFTFPGCSLDLSGPVRRVTARDAVS